MDFTKINKYIGFCFNICIPNTRVCITNYYVNIVNVYEQYTPLKNNNNHDIKVEHEKQG